MNENCCKDENQKSKGRKSMKLDVPTTGCVPCPLMLFMVLKFQILWQKRQGQRLNAGIFPGTVQGGECKGLDSNPSTPHPPTPAMEEKHTH